MSRSQDERQINVLLLRRPDVVSDLQELSTSDHLINGTETKLGHNSTEFIGHVVEEVDNMLRSPLELLPELWILGSNTNWASIQVALIKYIMVSKDIGTNKRIIVRITCLPHHYTA